MGPLRSAELADVDRRVDRLTFDVGRTRRKPATGPGAPALKTIVLAIDGSAGSRVALEWASALGQARGARVHVVSVAPLPNPAPGSEWTEYRALLQGQEQDAERVLSQAVAWLKARNVSAKARLEHGSPAGRIAAAARELAADVVVLGAHGRAGKEVRLGSVADGVRHHTPCAVLLARTPPPVRKVLAATDGSPQSRRAAAAAFEVARRFGAAVALQHVVDLPAYGDSAQAFALEQAKAAEVLEELRREDEGSAHGPAQYLLSGGAPGPAIVEACRSTGAGLLVLGSRGRGGVRSLVLGSVSGRASRDAPCSVLVVR